MNKLSKKNVEDIKDLEGKKVLVRCDFNVPLDENRNITDNSRIVKALDTIKYLLKNNAKLILCSHLGRPKGEFKEEFSLKPVRDELERLLNVNVILAKDVVGEDAKEKAQNLKDGEILLLENVRFEKGETKNDEELAKEFAGLAEIFVNDAFGTAHRAHASTEGVTKYLPAYAGYLIEKEIEFLSNAINDPERPLLAILGGAKVSDKLLVIDSLLEKVDSLIICGAMAYTLFYSMGLNVGTSLCEKDMAEEAKKIMRKAVEKNVKILLPVDVVVSDKFEATEEEAQVVSYDNIPENLGGFDIGPKTAEIFEEEIRKAKTVIWNGPAGAFENPTFMNGTASIAKIIADTDCISIIGGGDSAAAIVKLGLEDKFSHISTGGGASLEFLEGKELPGVVALLDK